MKKITILIIALSAFYMLNAQTVTKNTTEKKQTDSLQASQQRRADSGKKDYLIYKLKEVAIKKPAKPAADTVKTKAKKN
jgi:hypothetical protein